MRRRKRFKKRKRRFTKHGRRKMNSRLVARGGIQLT